MRRRKPHRLQASWAPCGNQEAAGSSQTTAIQESRDGGRPAAPTERLRRVTQTQAGSAFLFPKTLLSFLMLGVWQSPVAFQQTCSLILNGLCSLKLEATDEGERLSGGPALPAPLDFDLSHLLLSLTFSGGFPDNCSSFQEQTS